MTEGIAEPAWVCFLEARSQELRRVNGRSEKEKIARRLMHGLVAFREDRDRLSLSFSHILPLYDSVRALIEKVGVDFDSVAKGDLRYLECPSGEREEVEAVRSEILALAPDRPEEEHVFPVLSFKQHVASRTGLPQSPARPSCECQQAAVWGDLRWEKLLKEEATKRNVEQLLSRWQRPDV